MPVAVAIVVIVVGAILTFALADGSVGGFDLRIVGVILMLGGAAGLLLPLLLSTRARRSRSSVRSRQDVIDDRRLCPVLTGPREGIDICRRQTCPS
ncbi:DUF6458 family protein [Nonomuraea fuscirosea]|uniref:DUF6458 family protein n=1 Tax=Nonomuraea fuscirosea TaxID=1291556 RepID=UPI00341854FE